MLHVVDNLLPDALRLGLRGYAKPTRHQATAPRRCPVQLATGARSGPLPPSPEHQRLMERYLVEHLLPLARPFAGAMDGVEWWSRNNDLDWHIEKTKPRATQRHDPTAAALDGVLSPRELRRWRVAGGRQPSHSAGHRGPLPPFSSVISIPRSATGWCCSPPVCCIGSTPSRGSVTRGGEPLGPRTPPTPASAPPA